MLWANFCGSKSLYLSPLKLEDGHTLFDYNVGLNEIVQLMIRTVPPSDDNNNKEKQTKRDCKRADPEEASSPSAQVNGHYTNGLEVLLKLNKCHLTICHWTFAVLCFNLSLSIRVQYRTRKFMREKIKIGLLKHHSVYSINTFFTIFSVFVGLWRRGRQRQRLILVLTVDELRALLLVFGNHFCMRV